MDPISLVIGLPSLVFSAYAVYTARSAKALLRQKAEKQNALEDLDLLKLLLKRLNRVKNCCIPWQEGQADEFRTGRNYEKDVKALFDLVDELSSNAPLDLGSEFLSPLNIGRDKLAEVAQKITDHGTNENKWSEAVSELNSLIVLFRRTERDLETAYLVDH